MELVQFSNFIKVEIVWSTNPDKDNKRVFTKSKASINPIHVTYYYPLIVNDSGAYFDLTVINVVGNQLWINVPYDEFDKFFQENVHRGMSFGEDKI